MNKNQKISIAGGLVVAFVGAFFLTSALTFANSVNDNYANESEPITQKTTVEIHTDSHWSGSIMDSGFDSETKDGYGPTTIEIDCTQGMKSYSLAIQKQDEDGYLKVSVIQDGTTLDKGSTTAAYGVVTLAGTCP